MVMNVSRTRTLFNYDFRNIVVVGNLWLVPSFKGEVMNYNKSKTTVIAFSQPLFKRNLGYSGRDCRNGDLRNGALNC